MSKHDSESSGAAGEGKVSTVGNPFFLFLVIFVAFAFFAIIGFWCYRYDQSVKHYEACQANLKIIGTALEMYSTDHSGHYPQVLSDISPQYVASIPTCPGADNDTYSKVYQGGT